MDGQGMKVLLITIEDADAGESERLVALSPQGAWKILRDIISGKILVEKLATSDTLGTEEATRLLGALSHSVATGLGQAELVGPQPRSLSWEVVEAEGLLRLHEIFGDIDDLYLYWEFVESYA